MTDQSLLGRLRLRADQLSGLMNGDDLPDLLREAARALSERQARAAAAHAPMNAVPPLDEQRDRLLQMADGWYDPGSRAPHRALVFQAVALLRGLVDDGYPVPGLYPTPDGGVRAEWDARTQAYDVSVVFAAGHIYYHALDLLDDEVDDDRHAWADWQQVDDALRRLLIRSNRAGD